MTALTASTVPLAVRIRNDRTDQMITGWLHGGTRLQTSEQGGFLSASFVVDQKLGARSDIIKPYSRVYFYDKHSGDTVWEGDIAHPGRSMGDGGSLLEVTVEGGSQLEDWSGQRIFIDRDMQAWKLTSTTTIGTSADVAESRGGSGADALTLAFPNSFHVETNSRAEVRYDRIVEAGQYVGYINYGWDCGVTNGSWIIRCIATPPSTVVRTQTATTSGSGGSGVNLTGTDYQIPFLQMLWNSNPSSTGVTDVVWTSFTDVIVRARLHLADGSWKTTGYGDTVSAVDVISDLLGDVLASTFDGPNASLDAGDSIGISQLAYPEGVTPKKVLEDLMVFEPTCTYLVGPSNPVNNKYSLTWLSRTNTVRYEFIAWTDEYSASAQPVDQYNVAVTRYKSAIGVSKSVVSTQSIPEMVAMGRTRRIFQDLADDISNATNATQANAVILADHRFPQNGGRITLRRTVVDLWTGRRIQPYAIQPGYVARIVGVNPSVDALNNSPRNGSSLCRIVSVDYDADTHSADIGLDSEPWSMFKAIAKAKKPTVPARRQWL